MKTYEKLTRLAESNQALFYLGKAVQHAALDAKYHLTRRATARKLRRYLATHTVTKLHLGAGLKLLGRGWADTDCTLAFPARIHLDVTRPFPVADGVFNYIYTEHLIEHLTREQASHMLRECHRVLKRGGVLRVVCPDFDAYKSCAAMNRAQHSWGHQFLYDYQTLADEMWRAGFGPTKKEYGRSFHPHLNGIDTATLERSAESLVVEGCK